MKSIRVLATLAAAIAAAGLASAMPAAASTPVATMQWKATYGHAGGNDVAWASVVSPDGNTVYVTGAADTGGDIGFGKTFAYDAATGATVWQAHFSPNENDFSGFTAITLSPDGSTVFVTGWTGDANGPPGLSQQIVAYNAATGAKLWQASGPHRNAARTSRVRPSYVYPGPVFAPAVVSSDGSTLFVTTQDAGTTGQTAAYDAATGAVLWTEPDGGTGIAVPTGASAVYVTGVPSGTGGAGITQAFDATTGATIWQDDARPGLVYSSATLSPDGTTLYVSGAKTTAFSTGSGTQLWSRNVGSKSDVAATPDGSAVIVNEDLATKSGLNYSHTVALDPGTGATLWSANQYSATHGKGLIGYVTYALTLSPDGSTAYVAGFEDNANEAAHFLAVGYSTATGALVWSARYDQRANNYGYNLAASASQVFLTGASTWLSPHQHDVMTTAAYPAA